MSEIDRVPVSEGGQNTTKPTRNYLKCSYCRRDKKACKRKDDLERCVRCIRRNRDCDEPQRSPVARVAKALIIRLTRMLLTYCKNCCERLYNVVFRHPFAAEATKNALQSTSSMSLNRYLRPYSTTLKKQVKALQLSIDMLEGTWSDSLKQYSCSPLGSTLVKALERLIRAILANVDQLRKFANQQTGMRPPSLELSSDNSDVLGAYQAISKEVQEVLGRIVEETELQDINSGIFFCKAFPPGHLAYIVGDREIARQTLEHELISTDMLNRSMSILAAEQNGLAMLQWIENQPTGAKLPSDHKDARGLTALEVSAILGLSECFEYSLAHPPLDEAYRTSNLFELTLASCSKVNADNLITRRYVRFEHVFYFRVAIELRRLDLVEGLKDRLLHYLSDVPAELSGLSKFANEQAKEVEDEYNEVWELCNKHMCPEDWKDRLLELTRQMESVADLVNALNYDQSEPLRGQVAVESMWLRLSTYGLLGSYNQASRIDRT